MGELRLCIALVVAITQFEIWFIPSFWPAHHASGTGIPQSPTWRIKQPKKEKKKMKRTKHIKVQKNHRVGKLKA